MILRKLSQVLGAIAKGFVVDTKQGGFPVAQAMAAPATKSDTAVHAAVTLSAGAAQTITSAITDPVTYRALTIKGNQAGIDGVVTIHGKDWAGNKISDAITASGSSSISGLKPFKEVDSIDFPARNGAGDTISVGISDKLGLYRPIVAAALDLLRVDNTAEAAAALDTTYGTFTPTTATNGARNYEVAYQTDQF